MLEEPSAGYTYYCGGIGYLVRRDLRLNFPQHSTDQILSHWSFAVTLMR